MFFLQSLVLGIVQGLTEFIPVSSSGHLVLVPILFDWTYQSLVFDTILHLGTAAALIIYFWKDLLSAIKNTYLLKLLIVGSIPAGLLGLLLEDLFEFYFRSELWVALFLLLGSILMFVAEKASKAKNTLEINTRTAFLVGVFQALALFPGFSRSGSTISGSMLLGMSREQAARFSFLLSIPIVLVASFFKVIDSYTQLKFDINLLIGFFSSFFVGLLAISFLLKFLKSNRLYVFIAYRLILFAIIILVLLK